MDSCRSESWSSGPVSSGPVSCVLTMLRCCTLIVLLTVVCDATTPIWSQVGHDSRHTGRSPYTGFQGPHVGAKWTYTTGYLMGSPAALKVTVTLSDMSATVMKS